jgi:hypothetical protein
MVRIKLKCLRLWMREIIVWRHDKNIRKGRMLRKSWYLLLIVRD